MRITNATYAIDQAQLNIKHFGGAPPLYTGPIGPIGNTGLIGTHGIQGPIGTPGYYDEPVKADTPNSRQPTEEELTTIARLIDIDAGFVLPLDERGYVIKYNGVKICGYKGRTKFKTKGGAKVSLATSVALKRAFRTHLKTMRQMRENESFTYRGCKASVSTLVDELIKSGKISIELE